MKTKGGRVQAYIGHGKGKTTAAFGLALRALGHGYSVGVLQFFKKGDFGEVKALRDIYPEYKLLVNQFGTGKFIDPKNPSINDMIAVEKGLEFAERLIGEAYYDIIILDEILDTLLFNVLEESDILRMLEHRAHQMEIVLTGRELPERLAREVHLISRIDPIKHPFESGLGARKGIEY